MHVLLLLLALGAVVGERSLLQANPALYPPNPATITVPSGDVIATPITPDAPYSQAAIVCNVSGDSRIPLGATYPLTVEVPIGGLVRVIFANGNLGGTQVTQQGEPGVIVQQGGVVIVQQGGSASPIVQNVGSPIVQQPAPPAALVVQQTPTVIQPTPSFPTSPVVQQPPSPPSPVVPPVSPSPPPPVVASPPPVLPPPIVASPPPPKVESPPPPQQASPPPPKVESPPPPKVASPPPPQSVSPPPPSKDISPPPPPSKDISPPPPPSKDISPPPPPSKDISPPPPPSKDISPPPPSLSWPPPPPSVASPSTGRKLLTTERQLLQDTVPGGPNNGLVEYVALSSNNTVPGFVVPNTEFGVPYIEFTATAAAAGQTATFEGVLVVALVVGGIPQIPFVENPSLSPECQVNVNFQVASS